MVLDGIKAEELAEQWAVRIRERMETSPEFSADEVDEIFYITKCFAKTAVDLLKEDPTARVPNAPEPVPLDDDTAHLVIELFLRGVNQIAKRLREKGLEWDQRKEILEGMSWKIFNLAKLLVGLQNQKGQPMEQLMQSARDLKVMMKHSAEELLKQELREAGVK